MSRKPSREYLAYLSSPKWKAKRKEVIARCKNLCEKCGKRQVRNIHHKHYDNLGDEPLDDLLGVCRPCHREIHGLDKEKKAKKHYRPNSKRKARNELRLKAIKLGVPVDLLKPLHNPPLPKTQWDFKERLLEQFKTR